MRLSDLMSHMGLATYPQIALVLFAAIFLAVVIYVLRGSRATWQRAANLPLADDDVPSNPKDLTRHA